MCPFKSPIRYLPNGKTCLNDRSSNLTLAILRRFLRLLVWFENKPYTLPFLSQIYHKPNDTIHHPVYSAFLSRSFYSSQYIIPTLPSNGPLYLKSKAVHYVRDYLQNNNAQHHQTDLAKNEMTSALLCGIRHFTKAKELAMTMMPNKEEKSIKDEIVTKIRNSIELIDQKDFQNIREGVFLLSHPLSSDIWSRSFILLTSRNEKKIEGVLLNKRPRSSNHHYDSINNSFSDILNSLTNGSATQRLPSQMIANLISVLPSHEFKDLPGREILRTKRHCVREICRQHCWFGGPVPDLILLSKTMAAAEHDVIPGVVSKKIMSSISRRLHRQRGAAAAGLLNNHHTKSRAEDVVKKESIDESHPDLNKSLHDGVQRLYLGSARWDITQLENELLEGYWIPFKIKDDDFEKGECFFILDPEIGNQIVWKNSGTIWWERFLSILSPDLHLFASIPQKIQKKDVSPTALVVDLNTSDLLAHLWESQWRENDESDLESDEAEIDALDLDDEEIDISDEEVSNNNVDDDSITTDKETDE